MSDKIANPAQQVKDMAVKAALAVSETAMNEAETADNVVEAFVSTRISQAFTAFAKQLLELEIK